VSQKTVSKIEEAWANAARELDSLEGLLKGGTLAMGAEAKAALLWWRQRAFGAMQRWHRNLDDRVHWSDTMHRLGIDDVADGGEEVPQWPLHVFLASVLVCLGASVSFHWFGVVNEKWYKTLARADYGAIALLILGSNQPPIHYWFFCRPVFRWTYFAVSILTCGSAAVAAVTDVFSKPKWRAVRAAVFVATGVGGAGAIFHAMLDPVIGRHPDVQQIVVQIVTMGALYILGAALYAFRIPERFAPGTFDTWLASHQLFHILVIAAALLHYKTCIMLFQWRAAHATCAEEDMLAVAIAP
jgi:channel protein (hemolysin III family)